MSHEHHTSHMAPGFGKNTNGVGIFIVAIVFVLMGLFAWWLWNNNNKEWDHYRLEGTAAGHGAHGNGHDVHEAADKMANRPLGMLDTITGNFIYELGNEIEIVLPDSAKTVLKVGRNSTEARLFDFLNNSNMQVNMEDKTKGWITCDRIYFTTGAATLTEDSKNQIERLATILKAFPAADIKVGGYTDTTGDAAVNTRVSTERANTVATALSKAAGKTSIASEGYGPLHPIADNETPEGRALNRRVDIRVTKK